MALDYSTFKSYILNFLWRENDTQLANTLDVLIQQANDELDVMTRDWQRRLKTVVIAPESQDFDLSTNVADFQAVKSLTNNTDDTYFQSSAKTFIHTTPGHIYTLRAQNPGGPILPYYGVDRDDGTLYARFVAPFSASAPGDLTMVYRIAIPNYASADASWLEDEYLNLYLYTVLKHCAMFLREDERVQTYTQLQADSFLLADSDDKHNLQYGGSPMQMKAHHHVP